MGRPRLGVVARAEWRSRPQLHVNPLWSRPLCVLCPRVRSVSRSQATGARRLAPIAGWLLRHCLRLLENDNESIVEELAATYLEARAE